MKYLSSNGCLFFYDRVLYSWQMSVPTMLFLLGFEAVTTYDISQSDKIHISKYAYHEYSNDLVLLKDFNIFDDIYGFLSSIGNVDDEETFSRYDCKGLKLLVNDLTGTGSDRTVPIIFKNSVNLSLVDINNSMYRITSKQRMGMSIFDLQAQKIHDIFADADFDENKSDIKDKLYDYNFDCDSAIEESVYNSYIYRLLDYKAMYSYALGVLYGCRCLGYDQYSIWRLDPSFWYNGDYANLVKTAWLVFHFHFTKDLPEEDNAYKEIVLNKLWNFTNDESSDVILSKDELACCSVAINSETWNIDTLPIMYSRSEGPLLDPPGKYLNLTEVYPTEWNSLDSSVIGDIPNQKRGIIDYESLPIKRYAIDKEINIRKAYRYDTILVDDVYEGRYLSPNSTDLYFASEGCIGWFDFDPNFNISQSSSDSITARPTSISAADIPELAIDNQTHNIVLFFRKNINEENQKVFVTLKDSDFKVENTTSGIQVTGITSIGSTDTLYCSGYFYSLYTPITSSIISPQDSFSSSVVYSLTDEIEVLLKNSDNSLMVTSIVDNQVTFQPMSLNGYSLYPSTEIKAFDSSLNDYDLRYYKLESTYYFWSSHFDGDKQWVTSAPSNVYFDLSKKITLYKSVQRVYINTNLYTSNVLSVISNVTDLDSRYIFDEAFKRVLDMYLHEGITEYVCQIIYEDDFGNSLLDANGNPAVWYDEYKNKYWNGLLSTPTWQDGKPVLNGLSMYDSVLHVITSVVDNEYSQTITINGNVISYSEFYSHSNYGIIRDTLKVYSDSTGMIDCYYDSYSDEYCIPNITNQWVTRSDITNLGYRFVDGTGTLYNGNTEIKVIVDNDNVD